jgi:NTE family protein
MGALVAVTYAHRPDWYDAVLAMKLGDFPGLTAGSKAGGLGGGVCHRARTMSGSVRVFLAMALNWGPGARAREAGRAELRKLVGHEPLNHARIPVTVTATDLRSGKRVVLRTAPADDAVYASAALAGVLPPLELGEWLLADGAYTDMAPVDLAREPGLSTVIAVDAGWLEQAHEIRHGYRAILRAMEICNRQHAHLRFAQADLTLSPKFRRTIDTLEFSARRECVAAGIRIVREKRQVIRSLLQE